MTSPPTRLEFNSILLTFVSFSFCVAGNGNIVACSCPCTNQFGRQSGDRYQTSGQFPRHHFPNSVVRRRHRRFTRWNHRLDAAGHRPSAKGTFHIDASSIHCWRFNARHCCYLFGATITSSEHITFGGIQLFGHLGYRSGEKEGTKWSQAILDTLKHTHTQIKWSEPLVDSTI